MRDDREALVAPTSERKGFGSLLRRVTHAGFEFAADALDADRMLQRSMSSFIEIAKNRYPLDPGATWRPGEPLKLLLAGYSGTRNTGADVRVEEMIRQFRHLFGDEELELSLLTIDPKLSRGYFRTVRQLELPQIFPRFLFDTVHQQHGVVACEGSMFKSTFANALATMMVGSLGLAAAEHKLSIGYGGEAGKMDPSLEHMVRTYCRDVFVLPRNRESQAILSRLGIRSKPGTDTAWTFEPAPPEVGKAMLERAGWDGKKKVLAVSVINPFWWPVRPDLLRTAAHALTGAHAEAHYSSVYFHHAGEDVDEKQERYIESLARAIRRFRSRRDVFVVLVGMEMLDRKACEALSPRLGGAPLFVSDEHEMYEMVSMLRQCSFLLASRYHAIVTSMPGGVVSAGVTLDERIRNLMSDRDQRELALEVDDPALEEKAFAVLEKLWNDGDEIRPGIDRCVVKNLVRMGEMGRSLVDYTKERHPEMPFRSGLGRGGDPWAHLPPLSKSLEALVSRASAEALAGNERSA